jgi:hypothetical protein
VIHVARGNYVEAGFSVIAVVPVYGDAVAGARKVTKAADKAGDLIKTGNKADEAVDITQRFVNNNNVANEAARIGKDITNTKGGVYVLKDGNVVVRSGRTKDLHRRELEHKRDPELSEYEFRNIHYTDDYATQRGLEQKVHDEFLPQLDKINPINPRNPNLPKYNQAAEDFLNQ